MFITSILKLNNSAYLFEVFQLKYNCYSASLLCLHLFAFPMLVVLMPDMSPVSISVIAITTVVAIWIAACIALDWIAFHSAISVSFSIFLLPME